MILLLDFWCDKTVKNGLNADERWNVRRRTEEKNECVGDEATLWYWRRCRG